MNKLLLTLVVFLGLLVPRSYFQSQTIVNGKMLSDSPGYSFGMYVV